MTEDRAVRIAVDLGAESGRVVLVWITGAEDDRTCQWREVHRFANRTLQLPSGMHWDVGNLWTGIMEGLRAAATVAVDLGLEVRSVGVDCWGVDWCLLGQNNELVGLPHAYRDPRNQAAFEGLSEHISPDEAYAITGIQVMAINSLYSIYATRCASPELLEVGRRLLFIPDLLHFWLCGRQANELTIASTSQMLDARTGEWSAPLLDRIGLDQSCLASPVPPGTPLGRLRQQVCEETGLSPGVQVILPASHDTASAVAAVPADSAARWCFLSSGTWSLLGAELDAPCLNAQAREFMFTNELGVDSSVRFLKNIAGLWLVQQARAQWSERSGEPPLDYETLTAMAAEAQPFRTLVNPDAPEFAQPGQCLDKIDDWARRGNQPVPETAGQYIRCCLDSLACAYRRTVLALETTLDQTFDVVHVVGGGSCNALLCQMTADLLQKDVIAGPVEATAIGNGLVQAMGDGQIANLRELRQIVSSTASPRVFKPETDASPPGELIDRFERLAKA